MWLKLKLNGKIGGGRLTFRIGKICNYELCKLNDIN
jgi:hypothetical protein